MVWHLSNCFRNRFAGCSFHCDEIDTWLIIVKNNKNMLYILYLVSTFFVLEYLFPLRKNQPFLRKGIFTDFCYFLFFYFIFYKAFNYFVHNFNTLPTPYSTYINSIRNLMINFFTIFPNIIACIIIVLFTELLYWLLHFSSHKFSFLWKIHKIHHSSEELSFISSYRFHFLEIIVFQTMLYTLYTFASIIYPKFYFVQFYVFPIIVFLQHSNINLKFKFLNYIFVTPQIHIYHHAKTTPLKYGVNYGYMLTLWDILFKTHLIPNHIEKVPLGLNDKTNDLKENFFYQTIYPFQKFYLSIKNKFN